MFLESLLHSEWAQVIGMSVIFVLMNFVVHHLCFKECGKKK